jgi:hypothetical protein
MTFLFTEDDVVELRRLGWFEDAVSRPKFNQKMTEDEWLLSQLNNLAEEYVSCQARVGELNFYKQMKTTATDFHRLRKALDKFQDSAYDPLVLLPFKPNLSIAVDAISKLCGQSEEYSKRLKGMHDPKEDAAIDAAKQVIELWVVTSGKPPTRGKGARYNEGRKVYPAGKCFEYVLGQLTRAYGESIKENKLSDLLKQASKKHKAKSGI